MRPRAFARAGRQVGEVNPRAAGKLFDLGAKRHDPAVDRDPVRTPQRLGDQKRRRARQRHRLGCPHRGISGSGRLPELVKRRFSGLPGSRQRRPACPIELSLDEQLERERLGWRTFAGIAGDRLHQARGYRLGLPHCLAGLVLIAKRPCIQRSIHLNPRR